jgi:uncharacterized protein
VWSRAGAGSVGAAVAAAGLALGATVSAHGPFLLVIGRLSWVPEHSAASLDRAVGVSGWAVIAVLMGLLAAVMMRGRGVLQSRGGWPWPATGLALGATGVLAWTTGSIAGWTWGLSITGPSRSLVESTVLGVPGAADWGTAMVVGVPVGTWLSARVRGPVAWRRPAWPEISRRFGGGLLMGFGGTLAAGCNIGNALTGLSVLAVNSVIATAGIAVGVAATAAGIGRAAAGLEVWRNRR